MGDSSNNSNTATWTSFLKSIATFTGDLSTLTAPSFILSGTSILEYSSYWGEHPQLFNDIAKKQDAESRMLAVTKWYTSTLKGSFSARHESTGGEKKPLNPVLGETFHGSWNTDDGEMTLIAEQVSHHPPISAYRIRSPTGIVLQGHNGQKSGFSGRTILVRQVGQAILTVPVGSETETYLITLPELTLEGLFFGTLYAELAERSYIVSSSGWVAMNEYSGKGWLSGHKNTIKTSIYAPDQFADPWHSHYVIEGQWIDRLHIQRKKHDTKAEKTDLFLDTHVTPRIPITYHETPEKYDSRRLWKAVATALQTHDYEAASRLKGEIEQEQRNLRKQEKKEGNKWEHKYFEWKEQASEVVKRLMEKVEHSVPSGYWHYIEPNQIDERK